MCASARSGVHGARQGRGLTSASSTSATETTRAAAGMSAPAIARGYPPPSQRSWWCSAMSAPSCSRSLPPRRASLPSTVCCSICCRCSGARAPGWHRMASGIPTLPMSCSSAACSMRCAATSSIPAPRAITPLKPAMRSNSRGSAPSRRLARRAMRSSRSCSVRAISWLPATSWCSSTWVRDFSACWRWRRSSRFLQRERNSRGRMGLTMKSMMPASSAAWRSGSSPTTVTSITGTSRCDSGRRNRRANSSPSIFGMR